MQGRAARLRYTRRRPAFDMCQKFVRRDSTSLADLQHGAGAILANGVILLRAEFSLLYRCNCVRKANDNYFLAGSLSWGYSNLKISRAQLAAAGCVRIECVGN
jgi:hypothetical protein